VTSTGSLSRNLQLLLLLAPGVVVLAVLFGYPLVEALAGSFGLGGGSGWAPTLAHYLDIFRKPTTFRAFVMTVYYAVFPVLIALIFATPLAALIQQSFVGRKLFNGIYKIPIAVPAVVAAFMAMTLLEQGGFISRFLSILGIGMPRMVRDPWAIGVLLTLAWKDIPFMTLIITGAFGAIPEEVTNAARAYGASRLKTFALVQIPLAMPGIVAAIVLTFIRSVGSFAIPDVLGPSYPLPLSVAMYRAYTEGEWTTVYAMGMTMTFLAVALLVVFYAVADRAGPGARHQLGQ
jgi:putative spermidine/putrescine transport system permease protein